LAGLFLCAIGSVCAGPALGQSQSNSEDPANGANNAREEVVELFGGNGEADATQQRVEVGSLGQIDLQVKDLDVTDVLRLLSMQSKKNIIASRNVSGKVSANLFGVDFYQALDAILQPNGFGYREEGDFIYVYTKQELEEIEKANRKRVTEVIRCSRTTARR
jgi:type II secretory pathway component HofQ